VSGQSSGTAVVFLGGDPPPPWAAGLVPAGALVIGADSGVDHALALGVDVDVAIGDFDSVAPGTLAQLGDTGAAVLRHPVDKDATDTELALEEATRRGAHRVVLIGGGGGRLDHLVAQVALLGGPRWSGVDLTAHLGAARVHVVRAGTEGHLAGVPGATVTLLAVGGLATGVHTTGLRFALHGEDLSPWSTRGVSNEFVATTATVSLAGGVLLGVLPDAVPPDGNGLGAGDPTGGDPESD